MNQLFGLQHRNRVSAVHSEFLQIWCTTKDIVTSLAAGEVPESRDHQEYSKKIAMKTGTHTQVPVPMTTCNISITY